MEFKTGLCMPIILMCLAGCSIHTAEEAPPQVVNSDPSLSYTPTAFPTRVPSRTATLVPSPTPELKPDSLRELAKQQDFLVGVEVQSAYLEDEAYRSLVSSEFNMLTPGWEMKFGPLEPQPGEFQFEVADQLFEFAEANQMLVRGHVLVWHRENPAWLDSELRTRDQAIEALRNHIYTVVGHYRGRAYAWDVVNEALNDDGSWRPTIWYELIGPDYVEMAFRWANDADPSALLFYNDYGAEGMSAKADAVYSLLSQLLSKGVPVDGVGLQMHIGLKDYPSSQDIQANIERLGALGLQVHITEMDVSTVDSGMTDTDALAQQAQIYADVLAVCLRTESCNAFTVWGLGDDQSWLREINSTDQPLLFDGQLMPKPAYEALVSTLKQGMR